MTIVRFTSVISLVFLLGVAAGCGKRQPATLDEALSLYRENKLKEALCHCVLLGETPKYCEISDVTPAAGQAQIVSWR
jgi:Fe-S-cluster containining protein